MKNPFIYGGEVSGKSFCNRKDEIKEILRDIRNSMNVVIFSQRRYGKTSLIKEVLRKAQKKKILIFYIDLYPAVTKEKFIEVCANGIAKGIKGSRKRILESIRDLLPKIIPKMVIKEDRLEFEIEFDRTKSPTPILSDLFQAVEKRADIEKKLAVAVFDEFQEIANYEDDEIERMMRSSFQSHQNVSYIFMGSKRHILMQTFDNPSKPFYKSAKHFPLGRIGEEDFNEFILDKFSECGYKINKDTISEILKLTECHPYYTQMLCHILYENNEENKTVEIKDISESVEWLIKRESGMYLTLWESLTQRQRQLLIGLAYEGPTGVFKSEFIQNYGLKSYSTVQTSLNNLIKKGIIEKTDGLYGIEDPFLIKWINLM